MNHNRTGIWLLVCVLIWLGAPRVVQAQCPPRDSLQGIDEGLPAGAEYGHKVDGIEDLNGDGYDDFIVATWMDQAGEVGHAYVYSGIDGTLLYDKSDAGAGELFGTDVGGGGDVDGDGYGDFIVGAARANVPLYGDQTGRVYLYSGHADTLLHVFEGEGSFQQFGGSVDIGGDVNNDGRADIVISALFAPGGGNERGKVYVYSGADYSLLRSYVGLIDYGLFGWAVDFVGDANNDNSDDIIASAPGKWWDALPDTGAVYVLSGAADNTFLWGDTAPVLITDYGYDVQAAGDVNNDGTPDVLIGMPSATSGNGRIWVRDGSNGALIAQINGALGEALGYDVTGLGDLDGDGYDEFAASGAWWNGGDGRVHIYDGQTHAALFTYVAPNVNDAFGFCIAAADLNGDGYQDLIVGARGDDPGAILPAQYGRVYTYLEGDPDHDLLEVGCDNCALVANPGQEDADLDGVGDACDNCLLDQNASQTDSDGDGQGDACDPCPLDAADDIDGDGLCADVDNCPYVVNAGQEDANLNGIGDACELPTFPLTFATWVSPTPSSSSSRPDGEAATAAVTGGSPVNMVIFDPLGDSMGVEFNTIQNGSSYDTLTDLYGTSQPDDIGMIPVAVAGVYAIRLQRDDNVPDSAKFTLSIRIDGNQLLEPEAYQNVTVASLGTPEVPQTYYYTVARTGPGDCNADDIVNASDIIYLVNYIFKSGPAPVILLHGDVNCSDVINSADIIYMVSYVFKSGPSPCSQTAG
jgi:hypothetical protein